MFKIDEIPLDDEKTWELLSAGNTHGVFQFESYLGRKICKAVQPKKISELADISAILRPGCLQSKTGDPPVSMTDRYSRRKHGLEVVEKLNPTLDAILKNTYNLLLYQEQAIFIAQQIANMTLFQADSLRKAIGHKDAQLMSELEKTFIDGCIKTGIVDEKQAKEIFSWIKASQRYSFNKSITLDTTVTTSDGVVKTVDNIDIGECIKCPNGICKVLDRHDHGIQDVYEITTEGDKKIKCTLEHKFLCEDGQILPLKVIIKNNLRIMCQK